MPKDVVKPQEAVLSLTSQISAELGRTFAECFAAYTVTVYSMLVERGLWQPTKQPNPAMGLDDMTESVRELYDEACRDDALTITEEGARARIARNKLLLALDNRGMNQAKLAKKLGKSRAAISRVFRNPERCRIATLRRIASVLDVDLSDILVEHPR